MTDVTVSVDDVESGGLPDICAKTGAPSDGVLRLRAEVGSDARAGVGWLQALAGPVGWVALMPLGPNRHRTTPPIVVVRIPLSHKVYERMRLVRRVQMSALMVFGAAVSTLAVTLGLLAVGAIKGTANMTGLAGLVAAAAGVTAAVFGRAFDRNRVHATVDASGRWLTLWGVHPRFVSAVRAQSPVRQAQINGEGTAPT